LIEPSSKALSIARQCQLLGLGRASYYRQPATETEDNLKLMRQLDKLYTACPFYGVRRLRAELQRQGERVNVKRIRRLVRKMGLEALYPKPNLSRCNAEHRIYPYRLRGVKIERQNQVWSSDITYIPMQHGFLYLVAVIDWFSRYVLSWRLSNTLDAAFCVEALEAALAQGQPEIFNTDQGSQFTSDEFTGVLSAAQVQISMDGRGRALDNIFIERLWRSVKYEEVYLYDYKSVGETYTGLNRYFEFYNTRRLHQSLSYKTPSEVYFSRAISTP
jgi:putative transposase